MTSTRITPKHTPGPYFYRRDTDGGWFDCWDIVASSNGSVVASITFWNRDDDINHVEQSEANAKLLAAAPILYDVLDALLTHANDPDSDLADFDVIRTLDRASAILATVRGDQT